MLWNNSGNMFSQTLWGEQIQGQINPLWVTLVTNIINNPLYSTTILRFVPQIVPENHDWRGRPDYLVANPGLYATGIHYQPHPDNPYRGMFCRAKVTPLQIPGGIYYQATHYIFLPKDPGEVYVLDDHYPKRQDAFEIQGIRYYATGPAEPCQLGDTIAAWKIGLSRERYPAQPNRA